jgi:hypothetical protein
LVAKGFAEANIRRRRIDLGRHRNAGPESDVSACVGLAGETAEFILLSVRGRVVKSAQKRT